MCPGRTAKMAESEGFEPRNLFESNVVAVSDCAPPSAMLDSFGAHRSDGRLTSWRELPGPIDRIAVAAGRALLENAEEE